MRGELTNLVSRTIFQIAIGCAEPASRTDPRTRMEREVGINFANLVHGGQDFEWGEVAAGGDQLRGRVREVGGIGNFWADLTRITLYVLLPICLVYALFLIASGVPTAQVPPREYSAAAVPARLKALKFSARSPVFCTVIVCVVLLPSWVSAKVSDSALSAMRPCGGNCGSAWAPRQNARIRRRLLNQRPMSGIKAADEPAMRTA